MIQNDETIAIGWCDNGLTDGKFTEGLVSLIISGRRHGIEISASLRVTGNQIARQRQNLVDHWYDKNISSWLLWVDSDIVLDLDAVNALISVANATTYPVISGVYFISKEREGTTMRPFPCVFYDLEDHQIQYIHPLPENALVECDLAGFGFLLMHRNVITAMREKLATRSFFSENHGENDDSFVGEDIIFFRHMKKAGIQLVAHTGALVKHMKRFSLDKGYYDMYWSSPQVGEE